MLSKTLPRLAVSRYVVFVKEAYKNKGLKAQLSLLPVIKRGKLLGRLYKGLSKADLAKLKVTAAKTPYPSRRRRVPRKPNSFALFTKAHMRDAELAGLNGTERLRRIGKMWRAQK